MMNRPFTRREKALILVLVVLLLAVGYAKLFYGPLNDDLLDAQNRRADAESALVLEQAKLQQMQDMEDELTKLRAEGAAKAEIPDYDNVENVMVQLDTILAAASRYSLTFQDVTFGDELVSRPVSLSFDADSYASAHGILTALYQCPYRCTLGDLNVASARDASVNAGPVSVSVTVTFYERITEAAQN